MEISQEIMYMGLISAMIICSPFVWYFVIAILKHRDDIFIKKRYPILLMIILCLLAMDITILEPTWIVLIELKTIKALPSNLENVLGIIYCDYQFITFEFIYLRLYLMYYDHKHAMQVRDIKWENIFNANTSSWFTKHRHTFGSKKWLKKPFIFITALFLASNIIMFIFPDYPFKEISEGIYILFCGIISLFISIQIESHDDLFYIKQECQYTAIVTCIGLVIFTILQLLSKLNIIFNIASYSTFIITIFITFCICSVYVLSKNTGYDTEKNLNYTVSLQQKKSSEPAYESSIGETIISMDTLTDDDEPKLTLPIPLEWTIVVRNKSGFVLFMNHLITEYSHENLIFISEVIQFKLWFGQKLEILSDQQLGVIYKLPNSLPVSSIITAEFNNTANDEFLRAQMLFNKYIKRDQALYEVNISDTQRTILETYFHQNTYDHNKWQNQIKLLKIYDEALKDIEWLLKEGFTRFQHSDQFYRYWKRKKAPRFTDKISNLFSTSSSKQDEMFMSDTECSTTINK